MSIIATGLSTSPQKFLVTGNVSKVEVYQYNIVGRFDTALQVYRFNFLDYSESVLACGRRKRRHGSL